MKGAPPFEDSDFLRLADGTQVIQTGALAPGVNVSEFDLWLYGIDWAWKGHGWSANMEVFLRWITDINADGPIPTNGIFQHGWYLEGGKFLLAKTLDVNLRYSQVTDDFGSGSEYAAGANWYPLEKATMKLSFDVTSLQRSPLQNRSSDILVGDEGVLFRSQFQAEF